jgi:hypothetical protein
VTCFDLPGEPPRFVQVDGREVVVVRAVVQTVLVAVHIGGGCYNDTAEDRICWRADHRGRFALASTPEVAARMVVIS